MSWLREALARPFTNMHQHLHRLRMAQPPAEQPETFIVDDPRSRIPTGNLPPPETRNRVKPYPLRPPYEADDDR